MAKIFDNDFMALPISIKRGNPAPVDTTAVWYDKTKLETYAASGATAYVGQVLTLVADGTCEAYMISNEAGTLVKLASTTASGDLAGDVAKLQTQVADLISKVGSAASGDVAATGLYKEIADVLAVANGKVASVKAGDNSVTIGGTATAPTVAAKISAVEGNSLSVKADGLFVEVPEVVHPEYSVVKDADSGDYSAVYHLTKDGTNVGAAINIPKDMVVKSGSVQKFDEGDLPTGVTEAGTYIVLVLANATSDKLYIKVDDLIDIYSGGAAADGIITVNVDPNTKKITATIGDGKITKAKLATAVQSSLDKADSAIQAVATGSANGTIAVDGADVAVKGLADAAYTTVASLNSTAKGYADAAQSAVLGTESDTSDKATVYGARKYAEEKATAAETAAKTAASDAIAALDVEDAAVTGQFVTAVAEADGKINVTRKAIAATDIPELGMGKISGLSDALAAKQDTVTFNSTYDAATNKAATMGDVNAAKEAVIGTSEDAASANTIYGAKADAKAKADAALASAKSYVDDVVSGDAGLSARVTSLEGKVDVTKVSTAIATAKSEAIADAKTETTSQVSEAKTTLLGEEGYTGTIKGAYTNAAAAKSAADAAQTTADAAKTAAATADGKAVTAQSDVNTLKTKVGDIPEGAAATTVVGYVDEKIAAIPAQVDYSVTCDTSTPSGVAKRYILSQKGSEIVTIDIPKDMVVESGTVETNPAGQPAGTYLVLTLANATSDKVYINVGDLIEYVTGAKATDGIITTAVDANHVLTATINDGTITKAKLTSAVQTSLGKADSAVQPAAMTTAINTALEGYVAKNGTDRLMGADEGDKLAGISEGAQVNKIETVKVGGVALAIDTNKAVNIAEISTDLLKQGINTLILNGGSAASL